LRIPVIEMVEIGAGGGSIARVDRLKRITVGPDSAGADPGPACYGRGGTRPTVTDADLLLGRIDPAGFSGGRMALDREAAEAAIRHEVAEPLALATELAALGVSEIVDEHMANAARVHAIESGKDARGRTLVAFGGAAPLHAARMAEKLGLDRVVVPSYAGVGSAVGFLRAPIAYEIVRSGLQRLAAFDAAAANALLAAMREEAEPFGVHALPRPGP
jgi:N-methylhydantoinase A